MGGRKTKKPKNFYFARIFVAFAVVFSLNFGLWQFWQDKVPWLTINSQEVSSAAESSTEEEELEEFNEIDYSDSLVAQTAADSFISIFPSPGVRWKSYSVEETVKGSVLDIVCPDSKVLTPITQKQKEWRAITYPVSSPSSGSNDNNGFSDNARVGSNGDTLDGAVGQVKIYHPGMGAVVFEDLKNQVSSCGSQKEWDVNGITNINDIGQESFTYSYESNRERNTATVFREGDIIGIVYGSQNVDTADLARQWNLRWQKDLKKFCLDPKSTVEDALRQPLYNKYTGYKEEAKVSLTDADKSFLSQNVAQKINEKYGIEYNSSNTTLFYDDAFVEVDKPALPTEPRLEPGEELEVLEPYQTSLFVSLSKAPKKPEYPDAPAKEPKIETFYGPAEDKQGPGCGWQIIGQEKPSFDKLSYDKEWAASEAKAQEKLENKYVDWSVSTWQYAIDYDAYVYDVEVWNTWVEETNEIIAAAEWVQYDEDSASYPLLLEEYENDLEIWRTCASGIPLPPPTPIVPEPTLPTEENPGNEPSPTPALETTEPTIAPVAFVETLEERQEMRREAIIEQCGARPVKPKEPKEPEMPRPEVEVESLIPNEAFPSPGIIAPTVPVVPNP